LRLILIHAYENTLYYKKLFDDANFNPYQKNILNNFNNIPFLTKAKIKKHFTHLTATSISKSQINQASTGGSTGIPLTFLRDRESLYLRKGQELYFDRWIGYGIGDKLGYFVAGSHFDGKTDKLKARIRNATCDRMISFDPHDITEDYLKNFFSQYISFKPNIIKCFPNALTPFALYLKTKNITVPGVRSVSCTGETLYRQQRELFASVFNAEIFEKVGTRESGVFACECRNHKGLHIFSEGVYLEILNENTKPAAPGEIGRLFLTDLFNKAMPLIRYEIGDMAVAGGDRKCSCGSQLPLIEKYLGRDRDIIIDSHGNPKPGYLFVEVIRHLNLNAQIQVVQSDKASIIVNIVNKSKEEIDVDKLKLEYSDILGPAIEIIVNFTDEIKRDPSGKFSYVKSEIKLLN